MEIKDIVKQIAASLNATSILCYGSWADKTADHKSDIDLLVIMPSEIPDGHTRQLCYEALGCATVLQLDKNNAGGWDNSWSPVNDKLQIENQIVEIGYNTTSWVLERFYDNREAIDLFFKDLIQFVKPKLDAIQRQ